jgi:hypothetical protein
VQHIFNTYITGNIQNLAAGSSNVAQNAKLHDGIDPELFSKLLDAVRAATIPSPISNEASAAIEELRSASGTPAFKDKYTRFMGILADHMQVLGPVVAPFLPALAAIIATV